MGARRALDRVPHRVLRGVSPSVRTRKGTFVYEVNPGAISLAARGGHDVVVVAATGSSRNRSRCDLTRPPYPYLLHSESTLAAPRPAPSGREEGRRRRRSPRSGSGARDGDRGCPLPEHYGLSPDRIRIVPNTIDVAAYARRRKTPGPGRRRSAQRGLPERYVLFAGRLVEDKGILDLIAARSLLERATSARRRRRGTARGRRPRRARVPRLRPARAARRTLALAEWTVVPSHREPWGVVVNEALACGCPVIVTDRVGAAADLVVDGVNGRVVPPAPPHCRRALRREPSGTRPGPDRGWTHEYAAEQFLEAIELALGYGEPANYASSTTAPS